VEAPGTPPGREAGRRPRNAELERRIRDLHRRNAQLSVALGAADHGPRAMGSTPDQVARAEQLARLANQRALEASQRAALMMLHAASAHDRAARLHQILADAGQVLAAGDHREKAALHRRLADEDRAAAAVLFGSRRVSPPRAGDS
jgi:hypothetical protein